MGKVYRGKVHFKGDLSQLKRMLLRQAVEEKTQQAEPKPVEQTDTKATHDH